jgi:hypothetical protein
MFTTALEKATAENGAFAKAIKAVVLESVKPLADEVDKLAKEIRAKDAVQEALQQTTAKGYTYEEEVLDALQNWSQLNGAKVDRVGKDNHPGDILIELTPNSVAATELSVIIEARDRESQAWGRQRITKQLITAMNQRNANGAIFLSRSREGLAKEIGEWAEGVCDRGNWVATTHEHLNLALRFLVLQQRFTAQRATQREFDASAIDNELQRITSINTHLTALRKSANGIESEAEHLKHEIRDALDSIEDAIRLA